MTKREVRNSKIAPGIFWGWKEHYIKVGDGKGGWVVKPAEYQMFQHPDSFGTPTFGIAQMDNGELIMLGMSCGPRGPWTDGAFRPPEKTWVAFSKDNGDTWTDPEPFCDPESTRPIMLAYLGKGNLTFWGDKRYFSSDYGRTWTGIPIPPVRKSGLLGAEGNALVDFGKDGNFHRMAEVGYVYGPGIEELSFIRWSEDGGHTYGDESYPEAWRWEVDYEGKTYAISGNEGSLVRAANGWIVAALRTTEPPKYRIGGLSYDDSLGGTAVSISKDGGKTWSPSQMLFEAGRHHAHLLLMPNGDIVMTMTVRVDVRDGKLASYRRGCDALISRDNGLTWNLDRRIVLDDYEFYDGVKWFNGECGHLYSVRLDDNRIITAHSNYLCKGTSLIRWKP